MELLTLSSLKYSAVSFAAEIRKRDIPGLYGVTDGKAVGDYVEKTFNDYLKINFIFKSGNSTSGLDFPDLNLDLKVTSSRQPQSSCPFRSASQKVYGLGYHLLIFVYDKEDQPVMRSARLNFQHILFVDAQHTADFQTTSGLLRILDNNGNHDDIVSYLEERSLPLDDIGKQALADRILIERPAPGYLTISPALQWRLNYGHIIRVADQGSTSGIESLS